ncbi:MAG: hypothetical protein Q7T28_07705 [Cypionkella sp.]|nr:hypothetical protein [Cypionkella sp.]
MLRQSGVDVGGDGPKGVFDEAKSLRDGLELWSGKGCAETKGGGNIGGGWRWGG